MPASPVIASDFDSGNIEVVDASNPIDVQLKMKKETFTEYDQKQHMQWFHFSVSNCKGTPLCLKIVNADEASYAQGYHGYWAFVSTDQKKWDRTKTSFDGKVIQIELTPEADKIWVAYFPPYSYDMHKELVTFANSSSECEHSVIGQSCQNRAMDLLKVGSGELKLWVIARQHPGESMAEWFMDGFIHELLSDSATATALRSKATLYLVPNMNPDGSVMGHLRTNAVGANLNREWCDTPEKNYKAPTQERSPEVLCTLKKMEETGVDFFMDVHGDEELPCNFLAGEFGLHSWGDKKTYIYQKYVQLAVEKTKPYFQTTYNYGNQLQGKGIKALGGATVSEKFDCCGTTLEMPYKNLQYPVQAEWNHFDCKELGKRFIDVMDSTCDLLKEKLPETYPKFEPWASRPYEVPKFDEPAYVGSHLIKNKSRSNVSE